MKNFLKIVVLALFLQSFQCTDSNEPDPVVVATDLETKKQEIQNYINSFACSSSVGCGFIAFGSKPCGGPRTYLLFSNSVDISKLKNMVKEYNEMDALHNIRNNSISDCMVQVAPTEVKCVNGICTIIK